MSLIPTPAHREAADTLVRKAFTAKGLPDAVHAKMTAQTPFQDPLSLEIALGKTIAQEVGAMPSGSLLHAAAADLIEDKVYAITYMPS